MIKTYFPSGDGSPTLGTKAITQNGSYNAQSDGFQGYSGVTVNVSGGTAKLVSKSITANGSYSPKDDNADGYSGVTVNVSTKSDKEILFGIATMFLLPCFDATKGYHITSYT